MKKHILYTLLTALLAMAFPFHSSGIVKPVDFNYPKNVSKEALSDLDKALKDGDGQMTP